MAFSPATKALRQRTIGWATLHAVFDHWGVDEEERHALFFVSKETYAAWGKEGAFPSDEDVLVRVSLYTGMYLSLQKIWGKGERADSWMGEKNTDPLFGGKSALEAIANGGHEMLLKTFRYLDAKRPSG